MINSKYINISYLQPKDCRRRIRGLLEPPGWRPGDNHLKILSPGSVLV